MVATDAVVEERRLEVAVRGGGAAYGPFDFVTVGGEVGVRAVAGLYVVAGAEAWGTNRILPPELQLESGIYNEWNWIEPAHLGAVYKVAAGPVEPYAGADALVANYYRDADGAHWAVGGRARVGLDWYMVENLAVGADLAPGVWSGNRWPDLDDRAKAFGPVLTGTLGLKFGI